MGEGINSAMTRQRKRIVQLITEQNGLIDQSRYIFREVTPLPRVSIPLCRMVRIYYVDDIILHSGAQLIKRYFLYPVRLSLSFPEKSNIFKFDQIYTKRLLIFRAVKYH